MYVESGIKGAPKYQLKGLRKVFLKKNETKNFSIVLSDDSFGIYDEEPKKILKKGKYTVYIGTTQPDRRSNELTGRKTVAIEIQSKKEEILYEPKSLWKKD